MLAHIMLAGLFVHYNFGTTPANVQLCVCVCVAHMAVCTGGCALYC